MVKDGDTLTAHPVRAGVAALDQTLGDLLDCSLIGLDAAGTRATLVALADVEARMAALRLRVAAHADEVAVGADSGATSTGVWWALATRQSRPQAAGQVRLAAAPWPRRGRRVGAGLASGAVHLDQARVIVHALEDLPTDLDPVHPRAPPSSTWSTSPPSTTRSSCAASDAPSSKPSPPRSPRRKKASASRPSWPEPGRRPASP